MQFSLMRFLDKYAGGLIIIPVYVIRRLLDAAYSMRDSISNHGDSGEVKTLMVQKYFGIGSIINAMPMVAELRKKYPAARIIIVTFSSQKSFLDIIDLFDDIITINPGSLAGFAADTIRALLKIRSSKIDLSVDLEFFSRFSMLIAALSGARKRVGFYSHFSTRGALLTHPVPFNHYKHISRTYLAMAESVGVQVDEHNYELALPSMLEKQKDKLETLLGYLDEAPIVLINVNASKLCELRKWPKENYANLIGELMAKHGECKYVLIGSPGERAYVENVIQNVSDDGRGHIYNIAGKTDFASLMALIEKSFLLVSNDSGPVHIAAGYKTNTLALYGPETPILYRPLNPCAVIMYKHPYCSPCLNVLDNKSFETCHKVRCLDEITVEDVMSHLENHFFSKLPRHEQSSK